MSSAVSIHIVAGTLPSGVIYNPQTYFQAIVARMSATVTAGILFGQLGGTAPSGMLPPGGTQPGLWYGNPNPPTGYAYWNDWNNAISKYIPAADVCGQYVSGTLRRTVFQCGAVTADTTLTTPDKSGQIALKSDLTQFIGDTQTFSGMTTVTVDWNNRFAVWIVLPAPSLAVTLNSINHVDGVDLDVYLENNNGSGIGSITVANTIWPNGAGPTAPSLSNGSSGLRVVDHIKLYQAGGVQFGALSEKNFKFGFVATAPSPVSAIGAGTEITIIMSDLLAGGSLLPGDFIVNVNSVLNPTTSADYTGHTIGVFVANPMATTDIVTVSYFGSDMLILSSFTPVAPFSAYPVNMAAGGIHNDPF